MQNVYKLTPSDCWNVRQIEKNWKQLEAKIREELKTIVCVFCYRLRHMLPHAIHSAQLNEKEDQKADKVTY